MVGGDKEIYEKVIPLFEVIICFPFEIVHGYEHQVHGRCRLWSAHEDVQSDPDRHQHGKSSLSLLIRSVCAKPSFTATRLA